jgi:nickel-type superoxide dismutase maturation protease
MFIIRRVVGESMAPALLPGQIVIARRTSQWSVGDVIIVTHDGLEKIKRITKVNGEAVFIEGDNPSASTDSRHFGWLQNSEIRGKILWPINLKNRSFQK